MMIVAVVLGFVALASADDNSRSKFDMFHFDQVGPFPKEVKDNKFYNQTQCQEFFSFVDSIYVFVWSLMLPTIADETKIILIGDSNIQNWDNSSYCGESCSSNITFSQNFGLGGATCNQLTEVAPKMMDLGIAEDRDWIVLHCGQNDVEFGECGPTTWGSLHALATFERLKSVITSMLEGSDSIRVLFPGGGLYPLSPGKWDDFEGFEELLEAHAIKLASESPNTLPRLVYINCIDAFRAMGNPPDLYYPDGVHFSPEGYGYWHEWIVKALTAEGDDADCVVWKDGECDVHASDIKSPTSAASHLALGVGLSLSVLVMSLVPTF